MWGWSILGGGQVWEQDLEGRVLEDSAVAEESNQTTDAMGGFLFPLSSGYGTCGTVRARFWHWLSGMSP